MFVLDFTNSTNKLKSVSNSDWTLIFNIRMAKNTLNHSFRGIDVDQYGEDVYKDEDAGVEVNSPGPDEAEVLSLLTQNKFNEALKIVLAKAPLSSKQQIVKDKALQNVLRIMNGIKTADIDVAVQGITNPEHIDTLMKYIYRGFEFPAHSAMLLAWHEKVFSVAGVGSIVRVLTDKRKL